MGMRKSVAVMGLVGLLAMGVVLMGAGSGGAKDTLMVREQNLDEAGRIQVGVDWANQPALTGTVNVGNLPETQAVSGTVNVGNLPAVQEVSGTVTVANMPSVIESSGSILLEGRFLSASDEILEPIGDSVVVPEGSTTSIIYDVSEYTGVQLWIANFVIGTGVVTITDVLEAGSIWVYHDIDEPAMTKGQHRAAYQVMGKYLKITLSTPPADGVNNTEPYWEYSLFVKGVK
ncbi:MAG: hypothetical protein ACOY93_21960 [Bacillota bacterium]